MDIFEKLRAERVRGASWYLEELLKALEAVEKPEEAVEAARTIRPGMASLDVAALAVAEAAKAGVAPRAAVRRLREYIEEAKARLGEAIEAFDMRCPAKLVTLSFSRAVSDFIKRKRSCIEAVYLAESRPGEEAAAALAEYGSYVEVVPIPDAAVGAFNADYAISGLDGFYRDGYMFNKVGTLPLFATAKALGLETIAVFESYKMAPMSSPQPYRVEQEVLGRRVEVPLFDKFKADLVDVALTDLGPSRPDVALIDSAWRRILARIGAL